MKKKIAWIIGILLLIIGVGLAAYPFISNYLNARNAGSEAMSYLNAADSLTEDESAQALAAAREYNEALIGSSAVGDPFGEPENADEAYLSLLDIDGSSTMGTLEIPVIDVSLAIHHGTGDDALQSGVGHLEGSSLPVGGTGTHAVLTGHSGMSSGKLFSDLDKLETGDVFLIHVLGDTLAYQVDQIQVVLPEETNSLRIDPEQDYVTLVTCTPFGINSHRLLVRGTRIPYEEAESFLSSVSPRESTWYEEYGKAILLGAAVMAGILILFAIVVILPRRLRKHAQQEDIQKEIQKDMPKDMSQQPEDRKDSQ